MYPAVRHTLSVAALLIPLLHAQPQPPQPPAPVFPPGVGFEAGSESWLGVSIAEVSSEVADKLGIASPHGVEIGHVVDDSPAAEADLKRGDVVTQFRGEQVQGVEHFARLVRETPPGRRAALEVWDESGRRDVEVTIGKRRMAVIPGIRMESFKPEVFDFDLPRPRMVVSNRSLGAELETLDGQLAAYFGVSEGVLVRSVDADTPAADAGLQAGDVIVEGRRRGSLESRRAAPRGEPSRRGGGAGDGGAQGRAANPRDPEAPRARIRNAFSRSPLHAFPLRAACGPFD